MLYTSPLCYFLEINRGKLINNCEESEGYKFLDDSEEEEYTKHQFSYVLMKV